MLVAGAVTHRQRPGTAGGVTFLNLEKLSERLSEVLGEQVFHDAGLTRTDEIGTLRERVAELEQKLLDRRQDLQDRDDELAAARAANRDLMTRLNSRAPNNEQPCPTPVVHTT